MIDGLLEWWRSNFCFFLLGSVAWFAAPILVSFFWHSPHLRQRLSETAVVSWFLLLSLAGLASGTGTSELLRVVSPVMFDSQSAVVAATASGQPDAWGWVSGTAAVLFLLGGLISAALLLQAAFRLRCVLRRTTSAREPLRGVLASLAGPLPAGLRIVVSAEVSRPFCCGILRPYIVLPESLVDRPAGERQAQLRAVLLHELAHVSRGDLLGRLLFAVALPLQFWNPAFWLARSRANDAAELLADEIAADWDGDRVRYTRALVELAARIRSGPRPGLLTAGAFASPLRFQKRMTMLLTRTRPLNTRSSRLHKALRTVAATLCAMLASSCWSAEQAVDPKTDDVPVRAEERRPRCVYAFEKAEVGTVFDAIAKLSGANIIVSPAVQGTVTFKARDIPWREALDVVARSVGAQVKELDRGILQIAP